MSDHNSSAPNLYSSAKSIPTAMGKRLWQPSLEQLKNAEVTDFARYVRARHGFDWNGDFQALWRWSVTEIPTFWEAVWHWHGIIGDMGQRRLVNETEMPGAIFFPDASLNFAENLLANADDSPAISAHGEDGRHVTLSRAELASKVLALAGWLKANNVVKGDRVAAYTPNVAEAVITMLATATLGAAYSSCSPDFGVSGAVDRLAKLSQRY